MSDKQFEFEGKKFDKEFEGAEPEVEGHFAFSGGEQPQFPEKFEGGGNDDKGFFDREFSS